MSDLSTLISRLEEATGANREIDALVCIALRDVPNAKYYKEVMIFDGVGPDPNRQWYAHCYGVRGFIWSVHGSFERTYYFSPDYVDGNLRDHLETTIVSLWAVVRSELEAGYRGAEHLRRGMATIPPRTRPRLGRRSEGQRVMAENKCPRCTGDGGYHALVTRAAGCMEEYFQCHLCNGAGCISDEVAEWLRIGAAHRNNRVERDESLRECAKRLGVSPALLSAMETGRQRPRFHQYCITCNADHPPHAPDCVSPLAHPTPEDGAKGT